MNSEDKSVFKTAFQLYKYSQDKSLLSRCKVCYQKYKMIVGDTMGNTVRTTENKTEKIGGLFLNGEYRDIAIKEKLNLAVACDGGYQNAVKSGVHVDVLVGDMDSIASLEKVSANTQIVKFPQEKNFTDGEAGLEYLIENGCTKIYIYFGLGKRFSHTIANVQIATKYANLADIIFFGMEERVEIKTKSFVLLEKIGTTISIAPFFDSVHIISSKGLKYPLENLTLQKDSARGVSNIAEEPKQEVNFESGILLVSVVEE